MRRIDEQYTRTPFYGSRRMAVWLRGLGQAVNRKRVQRLMQLMGIEAVYPKRRLSANGAEHKVFPYLLRGVDVARPDQVWSADITYIRLRHGFMYLVAVMDWFSRCVLAWELSNAIDAGFCVQALERALAGGYRPEVFNTDQGPQFCSEDFTSLLKRAEVAISMDGRGRVFDNIFIERLWRTVKYEEIYLHDYRDGHEARGRLEWFFDFYNRERPHQSLSYRTPAAVYGLRRAA
jgi:putative transposase